MRVAATLGLLGLVAGPAAASPPDSELPDPSTYRPEEPGTSRVVGGILASAFVGFGTGQAIEGRWLETGWIFTVGEGVSVAAFLWAIGHQLARHDCIALGHDSCPSATSIELVGTLGGLGFLGFHVGGIVDAVAGPGRRRDAIVAMPYVAHVPGEGAAAGLALQF
jgi:hypothetical protein